MYSNVKKKDEMNDFTYHDYDKKSQTCKVCGRQFKSTPKADNCPGIIIREDNDNETTYYDLYRLNRRLKDNVEPVAYMDYSDYRNSKRRDLRHYIYSLDDTFIYDETLPTAYKSVNHIPGNPVSTNFMKENNLEPKESAEFIGVVGFEYKGCYYFRYYYDKADTQPGDGLNYITKGRLKSEYSLSNGWIKKLG